MEQTVDEIGAVITLTITCQLSLMGQQFSEVEVKGANVAQCE